MKQTEKVISSKDRDKKNKKDNHRKPYEHDDYSEEWDEWYDDIEFENKISKIRKSIKKNYKHQDW